MKTANSKPKFPAPVLALALKTVVSASNQDPLANARDCGARAARKWICWLYDAVETSPKVNFLCKLPTSSIKPPKREFARLLAKTAKRFEFHYGFDQKDGWNQVCERGIHTNIAYGFYDELDTFITLFDLGGTQKTAPKKPKPGETKIQQLRGILLEIQERHLHEPNSDYYEYCSGCRCSPHNIPPHTPDCLVPRIAKMLKDTA